MRELYFVRHGESLWNLEDKICGATDAPLTEKGHEQAVKTGKVIADSGIQADMILFSPLQRAADTARHISEITGIPARMEPRLIEQNFGIWEGTSPRKSEAFQMAKQNFICSYGTGESIRRFFCFEVVIQTAKCFAFKLPYAFSCKVKFSST